MKKKSKKSRAVSAAREVVAAVPPEVRDLVAGYTDVLLTAIREAVRRELGVK